MADSPEKSVFEFLSAAKAAAPGGSELAGAEIHATVYQRIGEAPTVRVGNCESDWSPAPESAMKEFNADTHLQILVRPTGDESADLVEARETVRALAAEVLTAMHVTNDLGGRVCDFVIRRAWRGWSRIGAETMATVIVPITINPK